MCGCWHGSKFKFLFGKSFISNIKLMQNCITKLIYSEAAIRRCSIKKAFSKISQNSQENTTNRVSPLIQLQAEQTDACRIFAKFLNHLFLQNTSSGCFSAFKNWSFSLYMFHVLRCIWLFTPNLKHRILHKLPILKAFFVPCKNRFTELRWASTLLLLFSNILIFARLWNIFTNFKIHIC